MNKRKLIIDTDGGIDDALAIMLANASGVFDIKGITTVFGNVSLQQAARNVLYLTELYDIDCDVAIGAQQSILVTMPDAKKVHGENGLGNFRYTQPQKSIYDRWAWEYIYETALEEKGELEILSLGPLTNIAIAVLKYPMLKDLVKKIVVMAGAATVGNVSPYAEFNVYQDAHAAAVVLNAGFHDLVMVDLEACSTAFLTDNESDRMLIVKSKLGPLYEAMRIYQRKYQRDFLTWNPKLEESMKDRNIFCDAVAAAVAINQEIAVTEPQYVTCETQSHNNYGQTVVDWTGRLNKKYNVNLVRSVDREEYSSMFFESLNHYYDEPSSEQEEGGEQQ